MLNTCQPEGPRRKSPLYPFTIWFLSPWSHLNRIQEYKRPSPAVSTDGSAGHRRPSTKWPTDALRPVPFHIYSIISSRCFLSRSQNASSIFVFFSQSCEPIGMMSPYLLILSSSPSPSRALARWLAEECRGQCNGKFYCLNWSYPSWERWYIILSHPTTKSPYLELSLWYPPSIFGASVLWSLLGLGYLYGQICSRIWACSVLVYVENDQLHCEKYWK